MVRKEECPTCKGNKVHRVKAADGSHKPRPCPACGGQGFKVRLVRS